jgi:large subunit ribosomal protein L15
MPKRGFTNAVFKVTYTEVNLDVLNRFEAGVEITPELLFDNGIVKQVENGGVKILGNGEVTKAFTVKANAFSKSAQAKIEAAGGRVEVI